jgi:5-methylcytosine-specific restriction protein A
VIATHRLLRQENPDQNYVDDHANVGGRWSDACMNRNARAVVEQAGDYAALLDRVSVGGRFDDAPSDGPIRLLTDQELLDATAAMARLLRLGTAELTKLAGEIDRRSEVPDASLAKRMGTSGPAALVAQTTGMPRDAVGTVLANADAFRMGEGLSGEPIPPRREHIAAAFATGEIDPSIAAAMRRAIRKAEPGLAPWEVEQLELTVLAEYRNGYPADQFLAFLKQVPDMAHPEGGVPSEDETLPALASVTKRRLANGLTRWILDLDPLTDGFFTTALDANTAIRRVRFTTEDEPTPSEEEQNKRPLKTRRVDGVRLLAKQALKMDEGQVAGTAVTMLVTVTEEALRTGLGTAEIPACLATISAQTARMLAVDAEIIPVVLGGRSQVLDLGTGTRFFSEAQRRAMALRDKGCAGPGCDAPLSWCDGAHVRPAGYGSTSIHNGILLCWRCHQLLDKKGWQVRREDERWWWTPPPWIDPTGRRRPGGQVPPLEVNRPR